MWLPKRLFLLIGAGLDVMTPEPLPLSNALASCPNVVLFPHMGSATTQTREDMASLTVDNLLAALKGKAMPAPISWILFWNAIVIIFIIFRSHTWLCFNILYIVSVNLYKRKDYSTKMNFQQKMTKSLYFYLNFRYKPSSEIRVAHNWHRL